jgi:DNA-binding NarL/FixJ family response regulator
MIANALSDHRKGYLDVDMDGYISKPVGVEDLVEASQQCWS